MTSDFLNPYLAFPLSLSVVGKAKTYFIIILGVTGWHTGSILAFYPAALGLNSWLPPDFF